MEKIKWAIWAGEGEEGQRKVRWATETGIKRILTAERCGGDRWAYACPADAREAESASDTKSISI